MYYNLIVMVNKGGIHNHSLFGIIRPAADGLSDLEFQLGARIRAQASAKIPLEAMVWDDETFIELLENEEWVHLIKEEDEGLGELPSTRRLERRAHPETYNRGPYARKYRS